MLDGVEVSLNLASEQLHNVLSEREQNKNATRNKTVSGGVFPRNQYEGVMEQVRGIEPPCSAWEADILPLNYTCVQSGLSIAHSPPLGKRKIYSGFQRGKYENKLKKLS